MATTTSFSTDSSLIVRAQAGDADSWQKLVDLYAPWIFEWTRRNGLAPADAADVTQETLLAVYKAIGQFRKSAAHDSFRGWMWTIAFNKIRDFRRRLAREGAARSAADQQQILAAVESPLHPFGDQPEPATDPALTALLHRGLAQVQAEFEPQTWQAFWQVVAIGRSPADVAAELNMSAGSVRQAKSRILRRLRLQLGDVLDDPGEPA